MENSLLGFRRITVWRAGSIPARVLIERQFQKEAKKAGLTSKQKNFAWYFLKYKPFRFEYPNPPDGGTNTAMVEFVNRLYDKF